MRNKSRGSRKFIHIDIEARQIGRVFSPDLGIVSDAKLAVSALLDRARARGMRPVNPELAVASVYEKPIITVIVNNANLGLIRQNQKGAYGFEYGVDMPYNQDGRLDYVKVAEGFGCIGERVFTPEELAAALERALKSGKTYVIDAVCVQEQLCDMGPSITSCKTFVSDR